MFFFGITFSLFVNVIIIPICKKGANPQNIMKLVDNVYVREGKESENKREVCSVIEHINFY